MWYMLYVDITYPLFYYLPFLLILCFSTAIGFKLLIMRKQRKEKRGRYKIEI